MPKLSKAKQKSVGEAESSAFPVLPAGRYMATLEAVNADKNGEPLVGSKSGVAYWQWVFKDITLLHDAEYDGTQYEAGHVFPGHQYVNTSLSDNADWKMKEVFEAFGYSVDSDTDEMIGDRVVLHITTREIEEGSRKGEMGNNVGRVAPYADGTDDDEWDGE